MARTDSEVLAVLKDARDKCHDQLRDAGMIAEVEIRQRKVREATERLEMLNEEIEKFEIKVDSASDNRTRRNHARLKKA